MRCNCVRFGVLDMKQFEKHWYKLKENTLLNLEFTVFNLLVSNDAAEFHYWKFRFCLCSSLWQTVRGLQTIRHPDIGKHVIHHRWWKHENHHDCSREVFTWRQNFTKKNQTTPFQNFQKILNAASPSRSRTLTVLSHARFPWISHPNELYVSRAAGQETRQSLTQAVRPQSAGKRSRRTESHLGLHRETKPSANGSVQEAGTFLDELLIMRYSVIDVCLFKEIRSTNIKVLFFH